jgi:hypothetical protein
MAEFLSSPDTNPDEWVWNNVKRTHIGRKIITSISDLHSNVLGAHRGLQENPGIVRGFYSRISTPVALASSASIIFWRLP